MTNRERMIAVLEGEMPDRIPLVTYDDYYRPRNDPLWDTLFQKGLCLMPRVPIVNLEMDEVERSVETFTKDGRACEVITLRTAKGAIRQLSLDRWVQEYFLKTPEDYRVMTHIVRHTRLAYAPEAFLAWDRDAGARGLPIVKMNRSPLQTVVVDYAGLENYAYHLADCGEEMEELLEALEEQLLRYCALVAGGPGRYLQLRENLTAEQAGPARYRKYHMPVYNKILPMLHQAGKKVFAHYDGKLAGLAGLIAETELDGIDSLTAPPEGDMTVAEARAALPDKILWANLNISEYALPPEQLREKVQACARQGAPDGRRFWFQLSEDLPVNWKQSLPVVLDALAAMPTHRP